MGKAVIIFSDGTGQRGGLLFDERRSNIYKLYRATRCGPDSSINPDEQLTFYDPGLGTLPGGLGFLDGVYRKIYNLVSQATGLGITANIIDCYAAIIQLWQPGDRIFLFGFSRGAYTVRCLAAVLAFCGIPTTMADGTPLKRDLPTLKKTAAYAVKKVYQHVGSPSDTKYLPQRHALAAQFRNTYRSNSDDGSNAYPHFIGVFDTVASLADYGALALLAGGALAGLAVVSSVFWFFGLSFWQSFFGLSAVALILCFFGYLKSHLKYARHLPGFSLWQTVHLTALKMKFYDETLNPNVKFARHALSIDEARADFARVPWGNVHDHPDSTPPWLAQIWFAGNHSDIGGSYPENEARLSDTSLKWMVNEARSVPGGIVVDDSVLQLYPSSAGMQHDETKTGVFRYAKRAPRTVPPDAPLHPSVFERFELTAILQYDCTAPYRPENLRAHHQCAKYY